MPCNLNIADNKKPARGHQREISGVCLLELLLFPGKLLVFPSQAFSTFDRPSIFVNCMDVHPYDDDYSDNQAENRPSLRDLVSAYTHALTHPK
ncbi:hypothetical protein SAMN05216404_11819 [Nitrosospira multiformis]|uniref:Uncharacterized protein n=1 Tax=Nitrosospira multiformis TaxID=1231 RepID=A0A1H8NY46_9PROT|nr:hypothetical protein SAMN05216404_11819 [Nitrosospira multiformis]